MKTEKVMQVCITLEANESETLKEALKKVVDENNKAGFIQSMTPDEKKIVKDIYEKLC